jgi:hypothetical protein
MPANVGEEPHPIGRHGRLSAEYARASLNLEQDPSPPVNAAGRLGAEYQQAVAELVNNSTAFFQVVLDECFEGDGPGWPNDPLGEARRVVGGYRVTPRLDNQFVAIGAPVGSSLRDALVGARFRKLAGPSGGVYGLLLRDRGPGPRDGRNQVGRYYVAGVDDRGSVSISRREQDTWSELVPWTPSPTVRPGEAANDVSFEVVGGRLTLIVNGQPAASTNDAVLEHGGVGLFVAGDGNDVLVERFVVHALG